jgi:hypothetical protein
MTKRTLEMTNPTRQELFDAIKDAQAMGYKKLVAHGSQIRKEFGVRKKIIHLMR